MKHYSLFVFALILTISPGTINAEEIKINVKGMVCSFCAQGIDKTFKKQDEVEEVNVDLDKKIVELKTKPDKQLTDEKISALITDAGFDIVSIERKN
jgi:periplasmic mercuric ion binding protein